MSSRRERARIDGQVPLPNAGQPNDDATRQVEEALQSPATQADGLMLAELLDALPPDEREAVVLHYVLGLEVESKDKNKPTVAKPLRRVGSHHGRPPGRTARERLSQIVEERGSTHTVPRSPVPLHDVSEFSLAKDVPDPSFSTSLPDVTPSTPLPSPISRSNWPSTPCGPKPSRRSPTHPR